MSLPTFSAQGTLFSTAALGRSLFTPDDRYRLFAKLVFPQLMKVRPQLAKAYSANIGRTAIEPVLLLGVSLLQYLDGVPDRGAVELLRYHAGWNFALNRQLGEELFHPTTLSKFRDRLLDNKLMPGEPTQNFITGIAIQKAHESDDAGQEQMAQEQAAMGLEPPPVKYVDSAYISTAGLVAAAAQGVELIGPAQAGIKRDEDALSVEDFKVEVEQKQAICPAGKPSDQCSRLAGEKAPQIQFRFEWNASTCRDCPLQARCLGKEQKHKTLVVGEHHTALQARRLEQKTEAFKERMRHRNAIEGTQSELARAHGLRRARYRGLTKVRLQNYLAGAACNLKRWIRRQAWELAQAAGRSLPQSVVSATN